MPLNSARSTWPVFQALLGLGLSTSLLAGVTIEPATVPVGKASEVTLRFDNPEKLIAVSLQPGGPFLRESWRLADDHPEYKLLRRHNGLFLRNQEKKVIADFSGEGKANSKHYDLVAAGEAGLAIYKEHDWQHKKAVGGYRTSGPALDVALSEELAFVAAGQGGLVILDVENPLTPLWLGSHQKLGRTLKVSANSDRVAVLNDANTIFLLDVSNPSEPTTLSAFRCEQALRDISLYGDQLFALATDEILVLDFSATTPQFSNEGLDFGQGVNLGGERRVFIENGLAYVADWFSGIHIYDLNRPRQPELLSSFHTPGSPKGIVVRDGVAFVADDDHGLQVIDVSDPSRPTLIATLQTRGLAYTPRLVDDQLYLASHHGGFQIIDISNVSQPRLVSEFDTEGKAWSMEVHGTIAYVADDDSGLLLFDVADPTTPQQIGQYFTGAAAEEVMVRDNIAYVAFFDDGLHILDISDPRQPRRISQLTIPGNARGLDLSGDMLYVAGWLSGVHAVDISDTSHPRLLRSYDTRGAAWGLKTVAEHLYVMDWWGGVSVIDVSHPEQLREVGGYHSRGRVHDIATLENYAFVAHGSNGVQVFDIKNPLNPTWTTGISFPGHARHIHLHGQRAYVAAGEGGLAILDISNPFNLRWLGSYESSGEISNVIVDNKYAYLIDSGEGVLALDIRRKTPRRVAALNIRAHDLWLYDEQLYLATDDGIEVVRLSRKNTFESVTHYRIDGGARHIDGDGRQLYIASGKTLLALKRKLRLEEHNRLALDQTINDLKLNDRELMVTTPGNLINIDSRSLKINARYSLIGQGGNIASNKDIVYLSGEETITAVRPLPALIQHTEGLNEIRVTLPDSLAIGSYNLRLVYSDGSEQDIYNAVHVEMPRFTKPRISMEEFKKLLEEQQHNPELFNNPASVPPQ